MDIKKLAELRQDFDVLNNQRTPDRDAVNKAWQKYIRAVDEAGLTIVGAEQLTWEYMQNDME